ncbi:MAG: hypothetical protein Q3979_07945 [Actinomycetaceae bacterium]|nr:hypothetical protein [Actinomycetaceae bacterium]
MLKKNLALTAAAILAFSLSACGGSPSPSESSSRSSATGAPSSTSSSPRSSSSSSPSSEATRSASSVTRQEFVGGLSQLISQRSVSGEYGQAEMERFSGCVYDEASGELSEETMQAIATAQVDSLPDDDQQVLANAFQTCARSVAGN